MAAIKSGGGASAIKKAPKPIPKSSKKTPYAAAKKKPSVAPKKAAAAVKKATYQVPKKLTKSTPSNRLAGGGTSAKQTFSDMKKMEAKKYKEAQAKAAANAKKKPASPAKPAGKLDEMAQANSQLKKMWNKKNRLNSK